MAEKPYPSPANLTEQLQNLCWRLAVEMRALYNTVKTKMTKAEADDTYLGKSAKAASATKADTATKASQDAKGNVIDQTYAKNSSIPTVMKGATSAAAGAAGTVPAPAKGDQAKFLNGSGAWATALTSQTQADWNATSGVAAIKNKPTIPSKTSQLTNDSNFATTGVIPTKVSQLENDVGYLARIHVDEARDAVLKAGTAYTVPAHTVGKGVLVYLGGLLYTDFTDVSSTTISFDVDIPATMEIVVVVEA